MNRIHLRLYTPPQEAENSADGFGEDHSDMAPERADVIPFESARRSVVFSGRLSEPVDRARLIRNNNCCPNCARHDIEVLELEDAVVSARSRLPIPGTSTIVGFHCNDCGTEWPVYELTRRNG